MKRNRFDKTYTKRITRNVLCIGVIGGFMPYVLSMIEKDPVSELGIAWVTGVVGVSIGYFVRGFKDSKEVADDDYRKEVLERKAYYEDITARN